MTQYSTPPTTVEQQMHQNQNLFAEKGLRTQNEQAFYNAWFQSENARKSLETTVNLLQSEIFAMKIQINNMNINPSSKDNAVANVYETDEEELARETEWLRVKQREKKRKQMDDTKSTHSSQKQSTSTNRIHDGKVPNHSQIKHKSMRKPPPIIIENMVNYPQMLNAFTSANISTDYYQSKILNNNKVKINATNADAYRAITALLNNKGTQ